MKTFILIIAMFIFGNVYAQNIPQGKTIFLKQQCNMCHTKTIGNIESLTTKRISLDKLTFPDTTNLRLYLLRSPDFKFDNVKSHIGRFKGHLIAFKGTNLELELLINWLIDTQKL